MIMYYVVPLEYKELPCNNVNVEYLYYNINIYIHIAELRISNFNLYIQKGGYSYYNNNYRKIQLQLELRYRLNRNTE